MYEQKGKWHCGIYLLWLIVLIQLGMLSFLAWDRFYGNNGVEVIFLEKTSDTMAYDLFDKQFTHLLAVMTILVGIFGLLIPFLTYFFQRQTLAEEKTAIKKDFDRYIKIVRKTKQHVKGMNDSLDNISKEIQHSYMELSQLNINAMQSAYHKFWEQQIPENIKSYIYYFDCTISCLTRAKDKDTLLQIINLGIGGCNRLKEQQPESFRKVIEMMRKDGKNNSRFVTGDEIGSLIGKDSKEYLALKNLFSNIYDWKFSS